MKFFPFLLRLTVAQKQWQIFPSVGAGVRNQIIGDLISPLTMAQFAPASAVGVARIERTSKRMA